MNLHHIRISIQRCTKLSVLFIFAIINCSLAFSLQAQTVDWITQFGTSAYDSATNLTVDRIGNPITIGTTQGNIAAAPEGSHDPIVSKWNSAGVNIWHRQFGTAGSEGLSGVVTDVDNNIFVSGSTGESLFAPNPQGIDAFFLRYDPAGNTVWQQQLGDTTNNFSNVTSHLIYADSTAIYAGLTRSGLFNGEVDFGLLKYDANGLPAPTGSTTIVSPGIDGLTDIGIFGSSAYLYGYTQGNFAAPNLGGNDFAIAKVDSAGATLWTKQFGSVLDDNSTGMVVDSLGNIYLTGYQFTGINTTTAVLAKYDPDGQQLWIKNYGTDGKNEILGIELDEQGQIYLAGQSNGSLGGAGFGDYDVLLMRLDLDGNLLDARKYGSSGYDGATSLFLDDFGNLYLSGGTTGTLGSTAFGDQDAFLMKLSDLAPIPEPSIVFVLGILCLAIGIYRLR